MIDYEVRDGKRVAITCKECGCRLGQFEDMWYHFITSDFNREDKRDAQGHKCSLMSVGYDKLTGAPIK